MTSIEIYCDNPSTIAGKQVYSNLTNYIQKMSKSDSETQGHRKDYCIQYGNSGEIQNDGIGKLYFGLRKGTRVT